MKRTNDVREIRRVYPLQPPHHNDHNVYTAVDRLCVSINQLTFVLQDVTAQLHKSLVESALYDEIMRFLQLR